MSRLRKFYDKSIHGIGFYPAILSLFFLLAFIFIYNFEKSAVASYLKNNFIWLNLQHTEAARTIITTITAGVIGLTVFSFSMVMVVMSQAVSQLSNRIIDNLIGNKFQQTVLGFYLGTIISSFFLLSVVDDKGAWGIPSLSVFLLMLITIVDLFLFVSFLHFITQSVRFEHLIKIIHRKTVRSLEDFDADAILDNSWKGDEKDCLEINSPVSNYFQGVIRAPMLKFCKENNLFIDFYHFAGTYLVKNQKLLRLYFYKQPGEEKIKQLYGHIDFYSGQEIAKNPFYGYLHLTEIAIKALSPGINDPNTAVLCIHALTDLLIKKMKTKSHLVIPDGDNVPRIVLRQRSFDEVFRHCIYPICDYGNKDRFVRGALSQMIEQLMLTDGEGSYRKTLDEYHAVMNQNSHSSN